MRNAPAVRCGVVDVARIVALCLLTLATSDAARAQAGMPESTPVEGDRTPVSPTPLISPAPSPAATEAPLPLVMPATTPPIAAPAPAATAGAAPARMLRTTPAMATPPTPDVPARAVVAVPPVPAAPASPPLATPTAPPAASGAGAAAAPTASAAVSRTAPSLIRSPEDEAALEMISEAEQRMRRVEQMLAPTPPAPVGFDDMVPATPAADAPEYNPYGFRAAWEDGDLVSKALIVVLFLMSGLTWYILFTKLIEQHRISEQKKHEVPRFWSSPSLDEGLAILKAGTPYWYVVDRGLDAAQNYHGTLGERIELNEWVSMSIGRAVEEIIAQSQKGLAVLATVGSTAPFVGLLGTVWGIFHALTAIGVSGQASIDVVAGPVGEALIMTALGLAVAVPAVMSYNWLLRRNKARIDAIRGFASDLHTVLLSGGRVETLSHRGF